MTRPSKSGMDANNPSILLLEWFRRLGGQAGPQSPSEGMFFHGVVDAVPGANQFTINALAGLGAGKFNGVTNPYFAFVFRDAGGAAAAPQGEQQPITGYVTATGVFTTLAFSAAVGVGDEILIVSPYIAAMGLLYGERSGALAYMGQCPVGMAASLNTVVCPNLGFFPNDTFNSSYQMIVLRNTNALGIAPEMEMRRILDFVTLTGTFTTEAFSANVEENDIVLIIHNSVAAQISAYGIADAGSGVGIVRDAARTEANDWWNGQTIMILSGAARGQKRPIADFIAATDDIIPAPNFDAPVAAGDLYVILAHYNPIVPRTIDDVANALTSEVVGRKDDTPITVPDLVSSLPRYAKGNLNATGLMYKAVITNWVNATQFVADQLIGFGDQAFANGHYFVIAFRDVGGAAAMPQSEFRVLQTYTSATGNVTHEAFSVDLATGDTVIIVHQSLLFPQAVSGWGAFDTSSATVPADSTRAARYPWEVANHHRGLLLMPVAGDCRFVSRRIVEFTVAGGIFTVDPNNPFPAATGAVEYIILQSQTEFAPAAGAPQTRTPADVIGTKTDAPNFNTSNASIIYSLMSWIRGIARAKIVLVGNAEAGSTASDIVSVASLNQAAGFWEGQTVLMTSGVNQWLSRPITAFNAGTDTITVSPPFPNVVGVADEFIILSDYTPVATPRVQDVVIYPVAEDADTTEIADDGSSPAYYPAAAHSTAANAEGAPGVAFTEDIEFEREGVITIIGFYVDLEWQTRFLVGAGAGTQSSSKIQISRDGGATWVDVTDNFNNAAAVMTNRHREGVGRWIPTVVAGVRQLAIRLVHWTDDAGAVSTSEAQIRSNSYIRVSYIKTAS